MFSKVKKSLLFSSFLLTIGFSYGTFMLLVPARSLISFLRSNNYAYQIEIICIVLLIAFLVATTFFMVNVLLGFYEECSSFWSKIVLILIPVLICPFTVYHWLNPKQNPHLEKLSTSDGHFVAGPYPTFNDLVQLKAKGYTGVISLLNPIVIPFEPIMLEQEKKDAKLLGMEFINLPMLPWVSQNNAVAALIEKLANNLAGKKYYVHCYLGEDRIRIFMRMLSERTQIHDNAQGVALLNNLSFSRGECQQLSAKTVGCPLPTEKFFLRSVISSPIKYFVSLRSDNKHLDDLTREYDEAHLQMYHIELLHMPIATDPFNAAAVLSIAQKVKQLDQPALVYDFFMPPNSVAMEGFMIAYKTNKPPLVPSLFTQPMQMGAVRVIAPNVAIGPQPSISDIKNYLLPKGIKSLIYLGNCNAVPYVKFKNSVKRMSMLLTCFNNLDAELYQKINSYGPWYLFGPMLNNLDVKQANIGQL